MSDAETCFQGWPEQGGKGLSKLFSVQRTDDQKVLDQRAIPIQEAQDALRGVFLIKRGEYFGAQIVMFCQYFQKYPVMDPMLFFKNTLMRRFSFFKIGDNPG